MNIFNWEWHNLLIFSHYQQLFLLPFYYTSKGILLHANDVHFPTKWRQETTPMNDPFHVKIIFPYGEVIETRV